MTKSIKETRLENGLTILSDRMDGVRSATLGFFIRKGSRHEPDELNGITHFIEHTVFKGTNKRTALDIAIEQDRLGGNLDAFTSHEETGFALKVIDAHLPKAFDLMGDMLSDPQFDEKELKSERRVIIEEIKMTDDSPEEKLGEIFTEAFYAGNPLGLSIAGTPKTVRTFNADITRDYHHRMFSPENIVVSAAGNIEHRNLVKMAKSFFGGSPKKATKGKPRRTLTPKPNAPILIKQQKNLEQAHLLLATPFVGGISDERYAADLLANIIGGGTSSRLWQKIREERGLAYSVGASSIMYRDCGFFSIFAATSPGQTGEVVDLSIAELRDVVKNGVSSIELDLVKDQSKASILMGLEDSAGRAASLAQSEMLHGRQIPVEETLAKIDAVTTNDLQKLAKKYFRTEKMSFAALGNLKGLKVKRERLAIS